MSLLGTGRVDQDPPDPVQVVDLGASEHADALRLSELWRAILGRHLVLAVAGPVIAELARNRTSTDIPSLGEVLSSPLVMAPVARSIGVEADELANTLELQAGSSNASLQALRRSSLDYAPPQRPERLGRGLRFLNRQEPCSR